MIAAWIPDGESVEIKKRGQPFATLIPSAKAGVRPIPKIDFAARLKKIWGDRVFSDEEVAAMRAAELEGEERRGETRRRNAGGFTRIRLQTLDVA